MSTQDSLKYFIASRSIYRFLREKVTSKKFFEKENLISGVPWKTNLQTGHRVTWDLNRQFKSYFLLGMKSHSIISGNIL